MMTRKISSDAGWGLGAGAAAGLFALGLAALLALGAAGIVLSTSWAVPYPEWVPIAALLVAVIAASIVVVVAGIGARRSGRGLFGTIWSSLRALGRFVFEFF